MRRGLLLLLALLLVVAPVLSACGGGKTDTSTPSAGPAQPGGKTLNVIYMAQAGYQPEVFAERITQFEEKTGAKVNLTFVKYDEQHEKIVTSAATPTATYDVISLDLIWTAEFAEKGYVKPLDDMITPAIRQDIAPAIWDAFTYNGKTWAMPFLANFQLFFYNTDMMERAGLGSEPPKTIEELETAMEQIKAKGIVQYPWSDSWNQKEGLVCEFVWLAGSYGGDLFGPDGKPTLNSGAALQALETMVRWLDKGLADPNSLVQDEPMAKDAFISGNAAFNSNWTFQYGFIDNPDASKVVGQGKMGLLPVAKAVQTPTYQTASVSGFQGMAIMANTKEPDLAWELVKFMTAPEFQAQHLEEMPVWTSVQTSPDTKAKDPVIDFKSAQIASVHHRPKVANYPEVSSIIQKYVHMALEKKLTPREAMDRATQEINALG